MAKNEHVVLRAAIYACFAVIFMQILIYGAGGFINLAKSDIEPSETVMLWAAQNLVPPFLGALLLAGIVAAALSSASTFLSLVGFSLSNDIFRHRDPVRLGTTRALMGAVSATVLLLSLKLPPNVFWIMLFIGTVFASSWGPVGFMSIWSKRITARGAYWGMVVGLLANVIPAGLNYLGVISLASYFDPALIGTLAALLTILAISRGQSPSNEEQAYLARLHQTPLEDRKLSQTRITLIAPALLVVYGIAMPFLLLHFYVKPYQRGSGSILSGDALNWGEAEPWIAFGPAALFIPLGLIATVTIWRRYRPASKAR